MNHVIDTNHSPMTILWTTFRNIRAQWIPLALFSLWIHLVSLVFIAPVSAWTLQWFLTRWGRCSIGNFELLQFFLSQQGILALITVGTISLAASYLELAGHIMILSRPNLRLSTIGYRLATKLGLFLGIGLIQLLMLLVTAIPFLLGIAALYALFCRGQDIYGLIMLRPPNFLIAVFGATILLLIYTSLAVKIVARTSLALPHGVLHQDRRPTHLLRWSWTTTRHRIRSLVVMLLVWGVALMILSVGGWWIFRQVARLILLPIGSNLHLLAPVTLSLLGLLALLQWAISVVGHASLASILLHDHQQRPTNESNSDLPIEQTDFAASEPMAKSKWAWVAFPILSLVVLVSLGASLFGRGFKSDEIMEITAHRAGPKDAPENTLAALRLGIDAKADWAEIDVQLTLDDAVVVLHDTDLRRVNGSRARVRQTTLAEIQAIDLGATFDKRFPGETIPTLQEMCLAAKDRIGLTVELKLSSSADTPILVDKVVAILRETKCIDRCRICSQSYDAIQRAKKIEPRLPIGFIAGAALGDLSRLQVDFLMVNRPLVTRRLTDAARARGIAIHAWTISDPQLLPNLVDMGVANIITDDPRGMRDKLELLENMDLADRLTLRIRHALLQ